jgi:hypothetical protein
MKNIFKYTLLASSMVLAFACTKDFEKINTDPDAYTEVPPTYQLAYVLSQTAIQIGDITGPTIWAGYMCKLSYIDQYNDFIPTNNTYGNKWQRVYWGVTQLNDIMERSTDETLYKNIYNVAKVYKNFLLLWNLDNFGDMPYSEAWKGAPDDGGILKSKYDKQEDVYPACLDELAKVADSWAAGLGSDALGKGDFLFGGDVELWQRFCNSLRLRYALRLSGVWSGAQALAESILNNPSKYPVIEENDQRAYFWWQGSGDYFEPWRSTFRTRPNDWCASEIFVNHLLAMDDPRLRLFVQPCRADEETYRGGEHGIKSQQLSNQTRYSFLGEAYMTAVKGKENTYKGFTPYYKACETYFMMAEAAMLGWKTPLSAKEAYEKAVSLSFADEMDNANSMVPLERQVTNDDLAAYLAGKGAWDGTRDRLYYEEWVALFKEVNEAWALYRRTGYPKYIQTAVYSEESAAIYANAGCKAGERQYLGDRADAYWGENVHTDVPFRMPYPNNQFTYNKENVEAASAGIVDYVWGKQLWWDKRTGVK